MAQGRVVDLTMTFALNAAKISADLRLPMADSLMLATARAYHATLWMQDADFRGIEGVPYEVFIRLLLTSQVTGGEGKTCIIAQEGVRLDGNVSVYSRR